MRWHDKFTNMNGEKDKIDTDEVKIRVSGVKNFIDALKTGIMISGVNTECFPDYSPLKQCFQCGIINHIAKDCHNIPKCLNCGEIKERNPLWRPDQRTFRTNQTTRRFLHRCNPHAVKKCLVQGCQGSHSSSSPNCPVKMRMYIGENRHLIELQKEDCIIKNEYEVFGKIKHELVEKQTTLEKLVQEEVSNRMLAIYGCNDSEVSRRWQQLQSVVEDHETRLEIQESRQNTVEESFQNFSNMQQELLSMMKEVRNEMPRREDTNSVTVQRSATNAIGSISNSNNYIGSRPNEDLNMNNISERVQRVIDVGRQKNNSNSNNNNNNNNANSYNAAYHQRGLQYNPGIGANKNAKKGLGSR